jgi:hypothetical protein
MISATVTSIVIEHQVTEPADKRGAGEADLPRERRTRGQATGGRMTCAWPMGGAPSGSASHAHGAGLAKNKKAPGCICLGVCLEKDPVSALQRRVVLIPPLNLIRLVSLNYGQDSKYQRLNRYI